MLDPSMSRILRAALYGGGSTLLALNIILLIRALLTSNFVPIVPILAAILTTAGLLLIVVAEMRAREEDKRDHRRIARVAHQLTSPLKLLQGDLESILQNTDNMPAELRLKVKRMESKSSILLENIRDVFLALQALEGPIAQDKRVYDLCTLLNDVCNHTRPLASAHNVEYIYKAHCRSAPVNVDKRLFNIAITHALENAILYSRTPGLVNVAVIKNARHARIVIQDRGIGITPADADSVFKPFARGQEAEKYDPDGIGIGLALSRLIMREFNGSISWRDRKNVLGSEFEFSLPLHNR